MARKTALALCALLLTAACGTPANQTTAAPGASAAEAGAFPATVEHKYGSTTVKAEPRRVLTVGLTEQDALLALGVVPIATTEWFGGYPGAIGPWAKDKLGSAPLPQVLPGGEVPAYEKIAALHPDLIIAQYSGLTQEQYDKLSKMAPVIAQPKAYPDYGVGWQEATKNVGVAVGKPAQARKLVDDLEAKFAGIRAQHPEFAGATGLMATMWEGYFVYGSQDPRSRVLASLGFKPPAGLDDVMGGKFGATLSAERTDLLNADALVWIVEGLEPGRAQLTKDPLYGGLRVAKEKRDVLVDSPTDYGRALSFVSVLSLPFVLDRLVPQLSAAVDGNPATEVKPA
ncbi:iron complex transport system substrate-binding protein [Amycolatopsis xylanica]|uniref:Iron complex transport system substrate-binding protein n=1 Tax=Amycolatopsis xylanica TaxID=589385 RepID=A0A1H3P6Q9_9PSEU|nr:iron-siderophore ABC transporter substrate-binding protein [Amycolatopsis xylanica]SDY96796.1 iron complex transport system substrate-binding protein [Amycolatopsis xylanica]